VVPDLLEGDLTIVGDERAGWSSLDCHIYGYVNDILPSVDHGLFGEGGQEELELVRFESEELYGKWFNHASSELHPFGCRVVDGSLVDQCW